MTPDLINAARLIAVLATGSDVAPVVQRIETGREPLEELPIQAVRPLNGELKWYLDAEACGVNGAETDADVSVSRVPLIKTPDGLPPPKPLSAPV